MHRQERVNREWRMVYPVPDDKSNIGSRHYRTRKQELRENEQDAHTQQATVQLV